MAFGKLVSPHLPHSTSDMAAGVISPNMDERFVLVNLLLSQVSTADRAAVSTKTYRLPVPDLTLRACFSSFTSKSLFCFNTGISFLSHSSGHIFSHLLVTVIIILPQREFLPIRLSFPAWADSVRADEFYTSLPSAFDETSSPLLLCVQSGWPLASSSDADRMILTIFSIPGMYLSHVNLILKTSEHPTIWWLWACCNETGTRIKTEEKEISQPADAMSNAWINYPEWELSRIHC